MGQNYRFVNKDGVLNVDRVGMRRAIWSDAYHALINLKWRYFITWLVVIYLGINLIFASLYWVEGYYIGGEKGWSFVECFFFSVQTLSTIGYGAMAPQSTYANALVTLEAFIGMLVTAMSTGLLFSKFSRPTARVEFSNVAVVHEFNGQRTLMFRLANMRGNQIVDAQIDVSFARFETSSEGAEFRRFYDLEMTRKRTAMFVLTWTAMHILDECSPLYGLSKQDWYDSQAEIVVLISGVDGTFGQTVHARYSYTIDEICYDARFKDMLHVREDDGVLEVNYHNFNEIEERGSCV